MSEERPWEDFQDPLTASAPPTAAPAEAAPWEAYTDPIAGPDKPPPQFNQPFGELKPYTPSPSERVGQWASDLFRGAGADPYTAGKFGRGARDVLGLTPAGPLMAGADVQHYAGEGDYGKAALSAVGVLPGTSLARSAVGEGVNVATRIPLNFAENPAREVLSAPTSQQLLDKGASRFGAYRNAPVVYSPDSIAQLANDMKAKLASSGQYEKAAPVTHEAIDVLLDKTKTRPLITPADIDEFRQATSVGSKKGESGAMQARSMLYDHLDKTGNDALQKGVADYAAGKRGSIVDTILRKSANASDPERALTNQLRSTVESTTQRPRGFVPEEIAALDAAKTGSRSVRALEGGANALTGGGGIVGALSRLTPISTGMAYLGHAVGGPVGGAIGFAAPGAAASAMRAGAGSLRRGAAEEAGNLVRQRSPMFQEAQAASDADPLYYPGTPAQNFVMRNAITQALINRQRGQ